MHFLSKFGCEIVFVNFRHQQDSKSLFIKEELETMIINLTGNRPRHRPRIQRGLCRAESS